MELNAVRSRNSDLEQKSSKDQRSLLSNESQFRDQLPERNTLLLTIYQYIDKILGMDKSGRKGGSQSLTDETSFMLGDKDKATRPATVTARWAVFDTDMAPSLYPNPLTVTHNALINKLALEASVLALLTTIFHVAYEGGQFTISNPAFHCCIFKPWQQHETLLPIE
ncbi:hypothetical protein JB92DRAFT_3111011 [Gautieria morchelliformis]|nr:hypothetical protein JB92DRAFT_3111011 [Gautieria morchelliformis]